MRILKLFTVLAGVVLILTACDVNDPIYETSHPDKGKINVTADWDGIGQGITQPSSYTIGIDGKTFPATSDRCEIKEPFYPGDYKLYAWNTADHITMNGTAATADYTAGTIGWLFTCAMDVKIEADKVHEFTAAMEQQVRELTLVVEPAGSTAERIESITATLSGVAVSYDMNGGTHGQAGSVPLTFTKITSGADAGKWTATVRLLGIVTDAGQKFSGTITFTDGSPAGIALDSDLTEALANFNTDKTKPLALDGTSNLPEDAGFTAAITDWTEISEPVDVN